MNIQSKDLDLHVWKGEILLESLEDASLLGMLQVDSVEEIQDDDGLWHVYHVSVNESQITSMGAYIKDGPWFIHFMNEEETVVIFKDKVFRYKRNNQNVLKEIKEHGNSLGIPDSELDFDISG